MRNAGEVTEVGTIETERMAFENPFFGVVERVIRTPDGQIRDPQLLWDRKGKRFSVAVVRDAQGRFVLVSEPKYGQMRMMCSAPTGGVKKNELPLIAAQREFFDETGYQAEGWEPLGDTFVDFADKTDGGEHYFFTAKNARVEGRPRGTNQSVNLVNENELMHLLHKGFLPAVSMAAVLLALYHLKSV